MISAEVRGGEDSVRRNPSPLRDRDPTRAVLFCSFEDRGMRFVSVLFPHFRRIPGGSQAEQQLQRRISGDLAALRRQPGPFPFRHGAPGLCPAVPVLGLGPACFVYWALPVRTASGFSPAQFWFSPTGLVPVRFGLPVRSGLVSVRSVRFGLVCSVRSSFLFGLVSVQITGLV